VGIYKRGGEEIVIAMEKIMYPDSLRIDERYAVELLKTSAIADRKPFDDKYAADHFQVNARGERVVVVINGKDYSREELLNAARGIYACMAFAS
jgi:hypothetical protein